MLLSSSMPFLLALHIINCGLISLVQGQLIQISTMFMSGKVIFKWRPSNYSFYDVLITTDTTKRGWFRPTDIQYTVRNVLRYDKITINVRTPRSATNNILTYNVMKIKTRIGDRVNVSWTTAFIPRSGRYIVYHTYRENRTIFSIGGSGVSYGGNNQSTKYTYLTRPFTSTNIMFEIRNITLDDAGYYNGGTNNEAAWSGGGVILIVHNKPSKLRITGDLNVEVNDTITLTCSSQSTLAPDYYSKLVTLSYTWFVNETKIDREIRENLIFYVTRNHKYNQYSCTATEEDMESDRSDTLHINPLYGPDRIKITPEPVLNINGKLTVREGETISPFVCTSDCNPPCNITWRVKTSDDFSDARSEMGTLLQQAVQRDMQLFRCIANWKDKMFQQSIQLDIQYLDNSTIYINDVSSSNVEVSENATLRISCYVDGNPTPTIRLSRVQADTELDERQGAWLNYTIDTAQCTDTDTYRCTGTSKGFNNREKVFTINVPCNISFDSGGNFKSAYWSKSGLDTTVNVAVPIIANPHPQASDFTWIGPLHEPVSAKTTICIGDVAYKHTIRSSLPVKDQNLFGSYTLSYKGEIITKITINLEDDETSRPYIVAISLFSFFLGLTWLIVALVVIYKRRYHSVHQNCNHGDESIRPEEALNMTQQYDDVHDMVAEQLEAHNMSRDYDDVQGTVAEGNYTNANGDNTVVEDSYTELGRRDPETPYEEIKA